MERADWEKRKKMLQITFSLNFLSGAPTCLSPSPSLGFPASVLHFAHRFHIFCLLQPCKQ